MTAEAGRETRPLSGCDVLVTSLATPVLIPPANRHRAMLCLICRAPIGAAPADQVVLWPVGGTPCGCGRCLVTAFLVHADCPMPDVDVLGQLVRERIESHHR